MTANPCKRRPRIATMLASSLHFRQPTNNSSKIDLARHILDFAQKTNIDCVFFPAGFLTVSDASKIEPCFRPVWNDAKVKGISVVIGIDSEKINRCRNMDGKRMCDTVAGQEVPCYLAIGDTVKGMALVVNQRSCTTYHVKAGLIPDEVMHPRMIEVGGVKVQIVFCGEVYDKRLFMDSAPGIAVICGHWSMPRLARTIKAKGRMGFSVVHSEHRTGKGGIIFCNDRGTDKSIRPSIIIEGRDGLWAELAVWEIGSSGGIKYHKSGKKMK